MTTIRLAATFSLVQVLVTTSAWAGQVIIPTPEPASMVLLAAGVAGVAVVRKFLERK